MRSLVVLTLLGRMALAEPRIVIVETPAIGLPALGAHVQLHGGKQVSIVHLHDAAPVGPRAAELLQQHDATVVVWIEPAEDPRFLIAHVATAGNRAELLRVDARTPITEIERVVALKLVALLDPRSSNPPKPVAPPRPKAWRLAIGAGMVVGDDRGVAAGPTIAFVRRGRVGSWIVAVDGRARWLRSGAIEQNTSSASVDETALAVQLELARPGRIEVFTSAGVAGALYNAHGEAMDGRSGSAIVAVPSIYGHVGARLGVAGSIVGVELGIEHAAIQQRFLVNGAVAIDLQRTRGVGAVWVAIPFR